MSISDYSFATPACTGACGSQDLDTLNANVAATAPASICVNAGMWNDYVGGVMTTEACGGYGYDDVSWSLVSPRSVFRWCCLLRGRSFRQYSVESLFVRHSME